MRIIYTIRIFLWVILLLVLFILCYLAIAPSGKITYVNNFSKENYFISKLSPNERLASLDKPLLNKIIANPVYFNLYTPRKFDKAELTLKYKNTVSTEIIETGVLADKKIWRYDLKPMENVLLDRLMLVWDLNKEKDLVLLTNPEIKKSSSTKSFSSVSDFLKNPPDPNQIAEYNFELKNDYTDQNYRSSDKIISDFPEIIGDYQLYVYIKNEDLDFRFEFLDLNKNSDKDDIDIRLYYKNELVDSKSVGDSQPENKGLNNQTKEINFLTKGLPEGVYKIEVKTNNDIVTKNIKTKQNKFSFINKIELFSSQNKNIKIYTDSNEIQFTTINPDRLQKISVNDDIIDINETYRQFKQEITSSTSLSEIILKKDGIKISGDGLFGFSNQSFFNPNIKKADKYLDVKSDGINYIIARYESPKIIDGWNSNTAIFDISNAYREKGKYSFIISLPFLESDNNEGVLLDQIQIKLTGKSLWKKLSEILKK